MRKHHSSPLSPSSCLPAARSPRRRRSRRPLADAAAARRRRAVARARHAVQAGLRDPEAGRSRRPGQDRPDGADRAGEGYVIGPQDNLSIIVTDEADLTRQVPRRHAMARSRCRISSRVPLAGLSLSEAQDKMTALLKTDYIRNPQVRIEVDQFKARSVLMTGEVRTQGKLHAAGHDDVAARGAGAGRIADAERQQRSAHHAPAEAGREGAGSDHRQPQGSRARQGRPRHHAAGRRHRQRAGRQAVLHLGLHQESRVVRARYRARPSGRRSSSRADCPTADRIAGSTSSGPSSTARRSRSRRRWKTRSAERRDQSEVPVLLMCGIAGVVRRTARSRRTRPRRSAPRWRTAGPTAAACGARPRATSCWSIPGWRSSIPARPARSRWRRADGRHRIVFNGEVYNYRELRRALEARGERFSDRQRHRSAAAAAGVRRSGRAGAGPRHVRAGVVGRRGAGAACSRAIASASSRSTSRRPIARSRSRRRFTRWSSSGLVDARDRSGRRARLSRRGARCRRR